LFDNIKHGQIVEILGDFIAKESTPKSLKVDSIDWVLSTDNLQNYDGLELLFAVYAYGRNTSYFC
jgi:hypothetical protein